MLSSVVITLASPLIVDAPRWLPVIASLCLLFPATGLIGSMLQGNGDAMRAMFVLNMLPSLALITSIFLVSAVLDPHAESTNYANAVVFTAGFLALCAGILLYNMSLPRLCALRPFGPCLPRAEVSQVVRLWLVNLLVTANNALPQILFFAVMSGQAFAAFSVSQRIINLVGIFIILANFFLAPLASRLFAERKLAELREAYWRFAHVTSLCALPFAALLFAFAPQVLSLFGPEFPVGAGYLRVLTGVALLNVLTGSSNVVLTMTGHAGCLVKACLLAFVVEVVALATLPSYLGDWGYVAALALGLTVQNLASLAYAYRMVLSLRAGAALSAC
ncbi:lipopolysaccharide biosynthesis protein [Brevirhabdus sp.]|uniref:lipopolysaccharide biosynthesis protein n=1 Tax=Brevirhabdus sp. TaxID=2004514 RepID=UPI0040586E49